MTTQASSASPLDIPVMPVAWLHDQPERYDVVHDEARALWLKATLPYKDPKSPIFERRNGHYVLRMMGGNDNGLPYGVYPRLLMSWITTEAVRTGSPELELGESLSSFLRNVLGIQRGIRRNLLK